MKKSIVITCRFIIPVAMLLYFQQGNAQSEPFSSTQLVPSSTFNFPYEITYGPNDSL
ncbi:MAG: hypothetical protein IPP99_09675 [Chitinophagaceae bacterium]|nr:hypothetical protein [Chitinophagaceae bacterium]